MSKTFISAALAAASLAAVFASAPVQAQPRYDDRDSHRGCFSGERSYDCRERSRYERRNHQRYEWRDGRYQGDGNVVAGSVLGFALGAAIAGNDTDRDYYNSHRNSRSWRNSCRSNYDGWDSRSGTYLGRDGYRHYCTR